MNHTPGPWNNEGTTIVDSDGRDIAYADWHPFGIHDYEQSEANARLIAAAPELLESLEYGIAETKPNDSGEYPYLTRHTVENIHKSFLEAIRKAEEK